MAALRNLLDASAQSILVAVLCCASVSCAIATDTQRVSNHEYRFSVVFPDGVHVCAATSGDQPHGFFVWLNGDNQNCGSGTGADVSAINISAYSNATFESSPEEEIAGLCPSGSSTHEKIAIGELQFSGRPSAQCHNEHADGSIDIYVVTQAGRWPGSHESQELNAPYINYTASLHSTRMRLSEDLELFRKVLGSVHIEYQK